jgi:hypothetical protein
MQRRLAAEREKLGLEPEPELVNGKDPKVERAELRKIACDYATPGPLSRATRDLIEKRQREAAVVAEASKAFAIGDAAEAGSDANGASGEAYEYESMPNDEPEALEVKAMEMETEQNPNPENEAEAAVREDPSAKQAQACEGASSMQANDGPPSTGKESVEEAQKDAEKESTEVKKP